MEIKLTDLRVGNTVVYLMRDEMDPRKEWWEKTSIDVEDLEWLRRDPEGFNKDHRAVELSEGVLIEHGFAKHESLIADSFSKSISLYGNLKELSVLIDKGNEYIHIREGERTYPTTVDTVITVLNGDLHGRPFYLHKVQNLFFALTGEELKPIQK